MALSCYIKPELIKLYSIAKSVVCRKRSLPRNTLRGFRKCNRQNIRSNLLWQEPTIKKETNYLIKVWLGVLNQKNTLQTCLQESREFLLVGRHRRLHVKYHPTAQIPREFHWQPFSFAVSPLFVKIHQSCFAGVLQARCLKSLVINAPRSEIWLIWSKLLH